MPDPLDGPNLIALGAIWYARLQETDYWEDRAGMGWAITAMQKSHRENVRRYLRQHCARLELLCSLYLLSREDSVEETGGAPITQTPLEWLYSTPLFHALVAADTPPSVNE